VQLLARPTFPEANRVTAALHAQSGASIRRG